MTTFYNPYNWYWKDDADRIFSSASGTLVAIDDATFVAWSAINTPSPWPRDDAGNQTDAALQAVLTPYSLFVNLTYYAADVRYRKASGGVIISSLSAVPFLSDAVTRNTINSAWDYLTTLAGDQTINWKMSDGTFIVLTEPNLDKLLKTMSGFVQGCFTKESEMVTGIGNGSVTTRAQVDAAFAAISNVFP